jgi:hypothetical protein
MKVVGLVQLKVTYRGLRVERRNWADCKRRVRFWLDLSWRQTASSFGRIQGGKGVGSGVEGQDILR